MINKSNFMVSGLPESLNGIPGTVLKLAEHYSVIVALHDISFAGYMKNNKIIIVKLNSIGIRDMLMGQYFKKLKVIVGSTPFSLDSIVNQLTNPNMGADSFQSCRHFTHDC